MSGETVDTALGELFTTCFASMLISVARVFQLGATREIFKDQLVGLATHCLRSESMLCVFYAREEGRDGRRSSQPIDLDNAIPCKQ